MPLIPLSGDGQYSDTALNKGCVSVVSHIYIYIYIYIYIFSVHDFWWLIIFLNLE